MKLATWMKVAAVGILGYVGYRLYKANTAQKHLPRPGVKPKPKLPILDRNTAEYKVVKEYLGQAVMVDDAAPDAPTAHRDVAKVIGDLASYISADKTGKAYVALCSLIVTEDLSKIVLEELAQVWPTYVKRCLEERKAS